MPVLRATHLECREGHFKEYNISIIGISLVGNGDGTGSHCDVPFTFGSIGSPNQGGKLNKNGPVNLAKAIELFEKQRRAKLAKGYVEQMAAGAPAILTDVKKEKTDWLPQLCNDADEKDLDRLLTDPNICLETKYDGKRIQVVKGYDGGDTHGVNRKGEKVGLPQEVADRINQLEGRVHLDGELVNLEYIAWDVLRRQARDYTADGTVMSDRRAALERLWQHQPNAFTLARHTVEYKRQLLETLRAESAEGGVFKCLNRPYKPGRPNTGGDWLRYKFWKSASVRVLGPDPKGKRSVLLTLYDGSEWKYAGKVTVPPNSEVPDKDAVVECRYLYARKASGCLYQPIYLGERDDIGWSGCLQSQLKFKQGDEEEEGEAE